jgi:hypothetical protein
LANQLGNPRLKLLAAIRLQVAFDYIRNFTKAVEYVELGFELIRELALESYQRGLEVFQDAPYRQWQANLHIGIGALLRQRGT